MFMSRLYLLDDTLNGLALRLTVGVLKTHISVPKIDRHEPVRIRCSWHHQKLLVVSQRSRRLGINSWRVHLLAWRSKLKWFFAAVASLVYLLTLHAAEMIFWIATLWHWEILNENLIVVRKACKYGYVGCVPLLGWFLLWCFFVAVGITAEISCASLFLLVIHKLQQVLILLDVPSLRHNLSSLDLNRIQTIDRCI